MRIATYYWPGMYWIDIAREKGWFEEAGLAVEFVDANADYYAAVDDLQTGAVDTIAAWLFDVVKRSQKGAPLVMVLATDESNGSEALVSSPEIQSVEQLRNRRIGATLGTALVYELDVMLSRFGLSIDDVTLVDIDAEKAVEELEARSVDAVITWEPFISEAIATGGNRLYDSSKLPGLIMAGMTFRQGFIQQRPEDVQRLLQVWHRTTRYINADQEQAFAMIAAIYEVTPEEVANFAEDNHILGLRDNVQAFTYASGLESLFGSARKINRFLIRREPDIMTPVDGTTILDGQFVRELVRAEGRR